MVRLWEITSQPSDASSILASWSRPLSGQADKYIPDLHDLAHVAGGKPDNLHDLL